MTRDCCCGRRYEEEVGFAVSPGCSAVSVAGTLYRRPARLNDMPYLMP